MDVRMSLAAALAVGLGVAPGDSIRAARLRASSRATSPAAPVVRVWLGDTARHVYRRGEPVRVRFSTDRDAFVTVLRVDAEGRIRVLFPRSPHEDNAVRGGERYTVTGPTGPAFVVDDDHGMGYVFALASFDRFDLLRYSYAADWDYQLIGDRVRGDPFIAIDSFARRMMYDDQAPYSTDYTPYYVDAVVSYPRFLCYGCHSYQPYSLWDAYGLECSRYGLVISDGFHSYPYYFWPGTHVVYRHRHPRYRWRDRSRGGRDGWIARNGDQGSTSHRRAPINTYRPEPKVGERFAPVNPTDLDGIVVRGSGAARGTSQDRPSVDRAGARPVRPAPLPATRAPAPMAKPAPRHDRPATGASHTQPAAQSHPGTIAAPQAAPRHPRG